jgi:D-alanyl-D-alanine carboxypeptidase
VIEAATGQPYHVAAHNLVLAQNGGRDIRLLAPDSALEGVVLPAPSANVPIGDIRQPRGAGAAVASAENMSLFLRDLLSGQVLPENTTALMFENLYPMFEDGLFYGLGMMVFDVPGGSPPQLWIGHSGGAPGARAILVFSPELQSIVAVALTGEGSVEATANLLFSVLTNE